MVYHDLDLRKISVSTNWRIDYSKLNEEAELPIGIDSLRYNKGPFVGHHGK